MPPEPEDTLTMSATEHVRRAVNLLDNAEQVVSLGKYREDMLLRALIHSNLAIAKRSL